MAVAIYRIDRYSRYIVIELATLGLLSEQELRSLRGGLRVIDYHFQTDHQIWLMTLFGKGEVADLTPAEKRQLNGAIGAEAAARAAQRGRRS